MWLERLVVGLLNRRAGRPVEQPSGILLGYARPPGGAKRAIRVPDARRCEHMVVVGKTGMGKTHFLQHLAFEHMRRGEGFVFFDFHGDATQAVVRLAAGVAGAERRVVVVDPTSRDSSPGLNPLEADGGRDGEVFGRASELSAILRARWSVDAFGARTEELLRNALYLLACHGLTLVDLPYVLTSAATRTRLAGRLPSEEVRSYWRERFEPLSEPMKAAFREPLLNKVTGFLTDPAIRHVLGQARSTVRFAEHMAQGHWVLVNLAKGRLREHAQTLGNLIFAKLQFDVMARADIAIAERRLCTVICDEVQNLAENDLATLLTEGRKFGVALVTANQFWEQLPVRLRGALLATGTQVCFRVSAADARTLAAELGSSGDRKYAGVITGLARGEAVARVGSAPPEAILVPDLPQESAAAGRRARELYALSVGRYSKPRAAVEVEIALRRAPPRQPGPAHGGSSHARHDEGQTEW